MCPPGQRLDWRTANSLLNTGRRPFLPCFESAVRLLAERFLTQSGQRQQAASACRMSFLTTFGASEAVRHPRIALPPFGGGVSGGFLPLRATRTAAGCKARSAPSELGERGNPIRCPRWDSNPCWSGFKPPASAIWATGACQATAGCDPSAHLPPLGAVMQRIARNY